MIGAIIGDIVGSIYEFGDEKTKDFPLFSRYSHLTDDSIMTLAVAQALKAPYSNMEQLSQNTICSMQQLGKQYITAGYGAMFLDWLIGNNPQPYNSFGNGSAMRISAVGFAANSIEEAKALSNAVTKVTHNHPEGLKGAEAIAVAMVLARQGKSIEEIKEYVCANYYHIDFTLDEIRPDYQFDETCQGSVPQAFEAFFESASFEDAIRNAISLGGDTDTIGAMAGALAEAYYGVPRVLELQALLYFDAPLRAIYDSCKKWNKIVH